ncbi:MAG: aldo/keto reductase [Lachnospiraceae bacterium]|nr:aldo/keto reductase [Lachnospiraceae bacterium]
MMKYRKLDGIEVPASSIVFGCCNPILINDEKGAEALLDAAFAKGFNTFDTAKVYGRSEEVLGRWLSSAGTRKESVIITKGCHPDLASRLNADALKEDIESSLDRLKTDHIDIYMLHRDDRNADIGPVLETLGDYVKNGVIRRIGASNWTHQRIDEANSLAVSSGLPGFSASSPQMSIAKLVRDPWGGGCVSISWDKEAGRWYRNHPEVPVFAYSCLGRGLFSGKVDTNHPLKLRRSLDRAARYGYLCRENIKRLKAAEDIAKKRGCTVAQVALSWLWSHDFDVFPVATISSEKRMQENIDAIELALTSEELERLNG